MASFDEVVEQLLLEVQDRPEVAITIYGRPVLDGLPVPSYGFTPAGRQLVTAAPGKVCDRLPELWQLAFTMDDYIQGMHVNVTTEMLQVALENTPELAELYARQDRFTHSSSKDQVEQVMWCVDNAPHLVLAAIEENPRTMADYHTVAVLRLAPEVVVACWERLPEDEISDIAARAGRTDAAPDVLDAMFTKDLRKWIALCPELVRRVVPISFAQFVAENPFESLDALRKIKQDPEAPSRKLSMAPRSHSGLGID